MMTREPFAALALVLLSTCAGATSICRWVDERGRTQIAEVVPEKYKKAAICTDSRRYELSAEQRQAAERRVAEDKARARQAASLNAQIATLQVQAEALRKKEVAGIVAKMKDAINHYGLTAADLGLPAGARKNAKPLAVGAGKPKVKRRNKFGSKPLARAVKLRTIKATPGAVWASGRRGSRPLWLPARLPGICWRGVE